MKKQRTIKKSVSFTGIGLHTGNESTIIFHPAPINSGFSFIRSDVEDPIQIDAVVENVVDLSRGTTLGINGQTVHTVEHVLAALVGLEIDNCKIELNSNEPPVGDGSAIPYVNALLDAGFQEQSANKDYFVNKEIIRYKNDKKEIELVALPNDDYRITVMVDYHNPALGSQHTGMFDFENEFIKEFAPARTFCFLTEVEELHSNGLIKGGSMDSGLVIIDKEVKEDDLTKIQTIFNLDEPPIKGKTGILNNASLRFKNEPARHKLLDMIGDLALVGVPLKSQILAARPGHASNIELVKKLRSAYLKSKEEKRLNPANYENFVFDLNKIKEILPHRYPFLLIDRVINFDIKNKSLISYKNVTTNEEFFQGHFPSMPVMPGVLIIEAMAQAGGLLIFASEEKKVTEGKIALFMSIKNAKFRKPVVPGDQLVIETNIIYKRFNTYSFKSTGYVNGVIVAQSEIQTALVDEN